MQAMQLRYRDKNKEKIRVNRRRRYEKNRNAIRAYNRSRRLQNAQYSVKYRLKTHEMEAGRPKPDHCELCGDVARRITFDHCHQRGVFRGWLCDSCNTILGHAQDDPNGIYILDSLAVLGNHLRTAPAREIRRWTTR